MEPACYRIASCGFPSGNSGKKLHHSKKTSTGKVMCPASEPAGLWPPAPAEDAQRLARPRAALLSVVSKGTRPHSSCSGHGGGSQKRPQKTQRSFHWTQSVSRRFCTPLCSATVLRASASREGKQHQLDPCHDPAEPCVPGSGHRGQGLLSQSTLDTQTELRTRRLYIVLRQVLLL